MKRCVDCVHCKVDKRWPEFSKCGHPSNVIVSNPVDGTPKFRWEYCSTMRGERAPFTWIIKLCGVKARHFEQR